MENIGLYILDASEHTNGYPDSTEWIRHSICSNGKELFKTSSELDSFGLRSTTDKLIFNGDTIGNESTDSIEYVNGEIVYNSIVLDPNETCINITLSDYNKLLLGLEVLGYSKFNREAIYNIVDDPNTSPLVQYDSVDTLNKIVYHGGELPENIEDSEETFINTNYPVLAMHPYNYVVAPGYKHIIECHVDSKDAYFINNNLIHDTFTIIIRDAFDRIVGKKTYYAGIVRIQLDSFKDQLNKNLFIGETYFSIQAINEQGVSSPILYFDCKFENIKLNLYDVTPKDLQDYNIVLNNDNPIIGYRNKRGLEKLFKDLTLGKFGLNFNGLKLYNSGNDVYFIDYHENLGDDDMNPNLGQVKYYLANIKTVNDSKTISYQNIERGAVLNINNNTITVDQEPLDWIKNDSAKLHRDPNDPNKILVRWNLDSRFFDPDIHTYSSSKFGPLTTWRKSYIDAHYNDHEDGYYYVVNRTSVGNDNITFPDNFILDLNNATIQGIAPNDISLGKVIFLRRNHNVTVLNGKVSGPYADCDMVGIYLNIGARLSSGRLGASVIESLSTSAIVSSSYCFFKNLDISNAVGYDGIIGYESDTNYLPKGHKYNYGTAGLTNSDFTVLGYIGYDGVLHNQYNNTLYHGDLIDSTSSDYVAGLSREVTPVSTNNKIKINFRYDYNNTPIPYMRVSPYSNYSLGKEKVVFVSFFNGDNFIKTVKSSLYFPIRIPDGATHILITGYGISEVVNNTRVVATVVRKDIPRGVSFELFGIAPVSAKPCAYMDCNIHDMRTIGLYPSARYGSFYNCNFDRIAVEKGAWWKLTAYLSDFEEGGLNINTINIVNCNVKGEPTGSDGMVVMNIIHAINLNIINTGLIGYKDNGGIYTSYIKNCDIKVYSQNRNYRRNTCYTYTEDCRIHDRTYINISKSGDINASTSAYNTTFRYNRHDYPIDNRMAFRHCIISYHKDESPQKPHIVNCYDCKIKDKIYR